MFTCLEHYAAKCCICELVSDAVESADVLVIYKYLIIFVSAKSL